MIDIPLAKSRNVRKSFDNPICIHIRPHLYSWTKTGSSKSIYKSKISVAGTNKKRMAKGWLLTTRGKMKRVAQQCSVIVSSLFSSVHRSFSSAVDIFLCVPQSQSVHTVFQPIHPPRLSSGCQLLESSGRKQMRYLRQLCWINYAMFQPALPFSPLP